MVLITEQLPNKASSANNLCDKRHSVKNIAPVPI